MKLYALCIVLGTFATTILGQDLHCYVCDGCESPTDENLEYCGPSTAPTTAPSTALPPISSTPGPSESPSTGSTPAPTESSPTSSTPGSTESSSTGSTPGSTESSSTGSTPGSTESSSTGSTSVSTESSPTASTSVSTESSTTAAETTAESTASSPTDSPTPSDSLQNPSAAAQLLRNYRSISRSRRAAGNSFACYSIDIKDENGTWNVKRGCATIAENQSGCDAVEEQTGVDKDNLKDCYVCLNDRCNGSAAVQISLLALLTAVLLKFVF